MIPMSIKIPKDTETIWEKPVPIFKQGNLIRAYLTDEIATPFDYNELCYCLETATAEDTVYLYINTPGGVIDTATMIVDAIKSSPATVIGRLSGGVQSAGTMIAMNCDQLVVADHLDFMIHTYSTTVQGKGSDLKSFQDHMDKAAKLLMNETYAGFLTKSELTKVIKGEEIWLNKAEVLRRWDLRQTYLKEQSNA